MGDIMIYLKNVATLQFFPEKCTSCKMCMKVCPHKVFDIKENKIFITDKDKCMECGACMLNCKFDAISVDTGVGCAEALIKGILTGKEASCDCG
jgi:NAD-dependent dihydropyrimidine dehydrogenase PreA subunit